MKEKKYLAYMFRDQVYMFRNQIYMFRDQIYIILNLIPNIFLNFAMF